MAGDVRWREAARTSTAGSDKHSVAAPSVVEPDVVWMTVGKGRQPVMVFYPELLASSRPCIPASMIDELGLSYKMGKTESKLIMTVLESHGFTKVTSSSPYYNVLWQSSHTKGPDLQGMQPFQRINHFARSSELTRKDRLSRNVQRMQETKGTKHFNVLPKTFLLPEEYAQFSACHLREHGVWIVKPVASSRGRGIYIINNPLRAKASLTELVVVSRYIERPLCIDGFKFDLRLYVVVTSYDPLRIYLFSEGLARFATVPYDPALRDLRDLNMHLTNYSINKESLDYVRCEVPDVEDYGNKWSASAALRHLKRVGVDTPTLVLRIEDIIIKSILSVVPTVAMAASMFQPHHKNCFELYGFDILVSEDLRPWVLEVNLSPSLACDTPMDYKIKSALICDTLSLVGVPLQDPFTAVRAASAGYTRTAAVAKRNGPSVPLEKPQPKVLVETREEYARRGQFVRIFPTEDSWDLYGVFLESKSPHNLTLHQQLYPHKAISRRGLATVSSATSVLQGVSSSVSSSVVDANDPKGLDPLQRVAAYERRLMPKPRPPGAVPLSSLFAAQMPKPSSGSSKTSSGSSKTLRSSKHQPSSSSVSSRGGGRGLVQRQPPVVQVVREPAALGNCHLLQDGVESRSHSTKDHIINNIACISEVQVRQVFAAYLTRVQERLLKESSFPTLATDSCNAAQDVDLVLAFLRQAAPSSSPEVGVNASLPVQQQQKVLAKHLKGFIQQYRKETERMVFRQQMYSVYFLDRPSEQVPSAHLSTLLDTASELELEEVLLACSAVKNTTSLLMNPLKENIQHATKNSQAMVMVGRLRDKQ